MKSSMSSSCVKKGRLILHTAAHIQSVWDDFSKQIRVRFMWMLHYFDVIYVLPGNVFKVSLSAALIRCVI